MDTKSKNRHKLGIVLILGVILLATVIVLGNYNTFYKNAKKEQDSLTQNYRTSESFMKTFIRDCYVLYSKESGNEYNVKFLDDYYPEFDEKSVEVSKKLAEEYHKVALLHHAAFLDASAFASPSTTDREHLDAAGHAALANAIYEKVIDMQKELEKAV